MNYLTKKIMRIGMLKRNVMSITLECVSSSCLCQESCVMMHCNWHALLLENDLKFKKILNEHGNNEKLYIFLMSYGIMYSTEINFDMKKYAQGLMDDTQQS